MRAIVRVALLVGAVAAGAAGMVEPAGATPGQGVTARVVWTWTVEETDYVLREITIRPGGRTGWHRHPGLVFANVRRGVLSHQWSDCGPATRYRAGESLMEDPDDRRAHQGENRGSSPVVLDVVYASPRGAALSDDQPDPGC